MSEPSKVKPRNLGEALASVVTKATQKWTATKKAEERRPAQVRYRSARMTAARGLSQTEAAAQVMEAAYMAASANGTLPANARQVMYAARPKIEALTNRRLDDQYFTQTLLPDFIEQRALDWDVVFDARGHFIEPHEGQVVNLGTLGVRNYLAGFRPTRFEPARLEGARASMRGPDGNFGAVLFIEKEGFQPLFERVKLAEQHDIAIMSTKGVSVTAARMLVDRMCGKHDIPLLVLHDFDVAGFTIFDTLRRDTRRYQFESDFKVIDLGLRLADVEEMGLEPEAAANSKSDANAIRARLKRAGATDEESEFLIHRRVELNAMTSEQFIGFIKRKLAENGVAKLVPSSMELEHAYLHLWRGQRLEEAFDELAETLDCEEMPALGDLPQRVREFLKANPAERWDEAVKMALLADVDGAR